MADATKLLPCPFCGSPPYTDDETLRIFGKRTGHGYAVACRNCEATTGGDDDKFSAIAAWNTRAALAAGPVINAGCCQQVRIKALEWTDFANVSASPNERHQHDNLAVALCSYFDGHTDCPADDEEGAELDDYDCWKVWVSESTEKVLRRIAKTANDHILAALEPAHHVNETPKSEHDRADVLTAIEPALATPAPDAVQEAAIDIAAIENGGKRWHGEDHRVVAVRWEPYKPDGQRQMKAKGRWQEQVGSGDYWRWRNCDRPVALRAIGEGEA